MRSFSTLLLASVLATSAGAQSTFRLGETVVLPALGAGPADHATVAVSARGDLFVTWQSDATTPGPSTQQVEGMLLRYLGGTSWELPGASEILLLGDPGLSLIAATEECRKPDVVAVGENFLVSWPRHDPLSGDAQLEAVRIVVPPSGPPVVEAPAAGQGFVVDPTVAAGDAGLMPDLARLARAPQLAAVVYAAETLAQGDWREYEIRYAELDFSGARPRFSVPQVIVPWLAVDTTVFGPGGGRVLPDAVEDDYGNLVVAYEQFLVANHLTNPTNEGHVFIRRYRNSAGVLLELDSQAFQGSALQDRQRRPNVAASRLDQRNAVSLAWTDTPDGPGDIDTRYVEVNFTGGPSSGVVSVTDYGFPNLSNRSDYHPIPVHGRSLRLALGVRLFPAEQRLLYHEAVPAVVTDVIASPASDVWRPAADLLEFGTPGTPRSRLLPITYEATESGAGDRRIHLVMFRI